MRNVTQFEMRNNGAIADPALSGDDRIIDHLLSYEERYVMSSDYLRRSCQIKPSARKEVTSWMLEVCEDVGCEEVIFPLSVNLMDRVLSCTDVRLQQLQLLASVALLVASKMRQCQAFTVEQLCYYTDHSIIPKDLANWELLFLSRLRWDLGSVVATDYIDYILHRLPHKRLASRVRQHAYTFISLCAIESQFLTYSPSVIAGASIAAAVNGLHAGQAKLTEDIIQHLQEVLQVDKNLLLQCINQIEALLASNTTMLQQENCGNEEANVSSAINKMQSNSTSTGNDLNQPDTPIDVDEVHF